MASCDQPHLICEDYLVILYIWTNILNKINSQTQLKKLIAAMEKMTDRVQSTRLLDPQMQLRIWDPACHETIEAHGSSLLGSCWYVFLGLLWIQWPRNKKEAEKLAVAAKKKRRGRNKVDHPKVSSTAGFEPAQAKPSIFRTLVQTGPQFGMSLKERVNTCGLFYKKCLLGHWHG
jgi:hypothetical protein